MRTPFLLSEKGSTRATAYDFGNKSVTLDGITHVTWLDAVARVYTRSYDHARAVWSEAVFVDDGFDNHTNPTFSVDRDRHLHIAYGPHGYWVDWNYARFRVRRAGCPNASDAWKGPENVGYGATYACLLHRPDNHRMIAYRGGEAPAGAMFQTKTDKGSWSHASAVFYQDIEPQYTHVGSHLACDSKGRIYYGSHFYNVGGGHIDPVRGDKTNMRSWGVALAMSDDAGVSWKTVSGAPLRTPSLYHAAVSVPPHGEDYRCGGVVTDAKDRPWVLCWDATGHKRSLLLNGWINGAWRSLELARNLPDGRTPVYGCLTVDTGGRFHIACTVMDAGAFDRKESAWAHPSSEVFHIVTDSEGAPVSCCQVSTTDPDTANWLPSISKPGPFCPIEKPVILYTNGVAGEGCSPTTETRVYCCLPD